MHYSYTQSKHLMLDAKELGSRIRQAREQRGLSQDELAVQIHRDQRAISEIEGGKRRVTATELPVFAHILNVPLLYFFEGSLVPDDLDRALLNEFNRLSSPEMKHSAIEMLRVFTESLLKHSKQ